MDNFDKLLIDADFETLYGIVKSWAEEHIDFKQFALKKLSPDINDMDFGLSINRCVRNSCVPAFRCGRSEIVTDWDRVYYQIKLWADQVEDINTQKLFELIVAIIEEVGMVIDETNFEGDDWNGDDFSGGIANIMNDLGDLGVHLIFRHDLPQNLIEDLKRVVSQAKKKDIVENYIGNPSYSLILELIDERMKLGAVKHQLFDVVIGDGDWKNETWMCKKIDFMREHGLDKEADAYIEENIKYTRICMIRFEQLKEDKQWDKILQLLDFAIENSTNTRSGLYNELPKWRKLKQNILDEHGSTEQQIENLTRLFHESPMSQKVDYYNRLKDLVNVDEWNALYHKLLGDEKLLDVKAPFLIQEGEFQWLFEIICEIMDNYPNNYHLPINYAKDLLPYYPDEIKSMLIKSIREYADSRFAPKGTIDNYVYEHFREDLQSLSKLGYETEMLELVQYFLTTYKHRRNLSLELKKLLST